MRERAAALEDFLCKLWPWHQGLIGNELTFFAFADVQEVRNEPHEMPRFAADARGRFLGAVRKRAVSAQELRVQIDGEQLRHYPDTDRLEIDTVHIRATGNDGAVTQATARRAIANADATEVQLLGGAHVTSNAGGEPIEFRGEFLHAFLATERLRSHLPVQVTRGGSVLRAAGMEYDHLARTLSLQGPMRAVFVPRARKGQG